MDKHKDNIRDMSHVYSARARGGYITWREADLIKGDYMAAQASLSCLDCVLPVCVFDKDRAIHGLTHADCPEGYSY